MSDIRFGKDDVTVQEVPSSDCEGCGQPIPGRGWFIQLDFRGAGATVPFGSGNFSNFCSEPCGEMIAVEIRKTLPECETE